MKRMSAPGIHTHVPTVRFTIIKSYKHWKRTTSGMLKVAIIISHRRFDYDPPLEVWVTDTLARGVGENMSCFDEQEAYAFARKYAVPIINMDGCGIIYSIEDLREKLLMYLDISPSGEIMTLKPDPDKKTLS